MVSYNYVLLGRLGGSMLLDYLDQSVLDLLGDPVLHFLYEFQAGVDCGSSVDRSVTVSTQPVATTPIMVSRVQGLRLIDPTRWPDRHGSCSAWSQGIKQVQFAWFSGQLGLIVNLASTHRATWDAMTPSFAGFLVHR